MKKFIPDLGGHDFKLDDFIVVEQAYSEALKGILLSFAPTGTCMLSQVTFFINSNSIDYSEGWIAINGEVYYSPQQTLLFSSFNGNSSLSPRPFAKIQANTITPASPVTYKDHSVNIVHYDRIINIKYFDSNDGDVQGLNGYFFDTIPSPGLISKGFVTEFHPSYTGEENDLFDSTGLGIKRMAGYAICNGINNTPDLRGQFTVQPSVGMRNPANILSSAIDGISVGQNIGNKNKSILRSNLPNYNLPINDPKHTHGIPRSGSTGGGGSDAYDTSSGASIRPGDAGTGYAFTNITVGLGGGSVPLDITPPAYAMLKIKRIL